MTAASPPFALREDAASAKRVIERVAAEHGRAISPEHFGVSVAYAPAGYRSLGERDLGLGAAGPGAVRRTLFPAGLFGLRP